MSADKKNLNNTDTSAAVQRVLAGDVNAYEQIYRECDRNLRAFLGARYGRLGDEFIDEVAVRTHERVLARLRRFDPGRASFQTWMNWQAFCVARKVLEEWFDLRRLPGRNGRRRDVPRFVPFEEDVHAQYVPAAADPQQVREREQLSRVLWQEYESLSEQGRLSIACCDLEGWNLTQTARRLGTSVTGAWRERRRALAVLKRRLQERGVSPFEPDTTKTPIIRFYGQAGGEDDDWCASVTAKLPDKPLPPEGAAGRTMSAECGYREHRKERTRHEVRTGRGIQN